MTSAQNNPTQGLGHAAIRRAQRQLAKTTIQSLTAEHDLQFVHIRNETPYIGTSSPVAEPKGGMTIAYRVPKGGGNIVEVATALCSPKDLYDKTYGKLFASQNFADGKRIKLRLNEDNRWGQQIKFLLGFSG